MLAAMEGIQQVIRAKDYYDYVDGILFSKDQGAINTGRLTNERANDNALVQPRERFMVLLACKGDDQ